jgi:oligopeptide/dipeptide ABC transporter ATP-binding protein
MSIRACLREPLKYFLNLDEAEISARIAGALTDVGLDPSYAVRFPHQLSGGQQQRVAIARAIITCPSLIVLDEPTSALDVSVRGQILKVLLSLQEKYKLAYLFISHDISVVRKMSHEIAVMYRGLIVERASTDQLFAAPLHPYTQALLAAVPIPDPGKRRGRAVLEGEVASTLGPMVGCSFADRCPIKESNCSHVTPLLGAKRVGHQVACHLVPDVPVAS